MTPEQDIVAEIVSMALVLCDDDRAFAAGCLIDALEKVRIAAPENHDGTIEINGGRSKVDGAPVWIVTMRPPIDWTGPQRPALTHRNLGGARCDAANWSVRTGFPVREMTADVVPFPSRAAPRAIDPNPPEAA